MKQTSLTLRGARSLLKCLARTRKLLRPTRLSLIAADPLDFAPGRLRPDAVVVDCGGYLRVDYDRIDVQMSADGVPDNLTQADSLEFAA
jgi:hypothetical protein